MHLELNELILEHENENGCSGKDSEREHSIFSPRFFTSPKYRDSLSLDVLGGRASN